MKKTGRLILYIFLGSFILIQFFRVAKNESETVSPHDFLIVNSDMPEAIKNNFRTSCYDCHSNNTNYPWYAKLAPFSWIIDQHILNGKDHLNFNNYDTLRSRKKIALLDEICEVISDSNMPPKNYLMLHQEAILSAEDIAAICDWSENEALQLIRNK
jgi:hypothetical protein